jgi:hypothetical protein
VIDAFNTDKPYNQFIEEQLAADRLLDEARRRSPNPGAPWTSPLAAMGSSRSATASRTARTTSSTTGST